MAEQQSSARKRASNSKSGGSKRSKSGGSGSRSKKSSSRASSRRTPTASQRDLPDEHSPSGGDGDDGGNMSKAEESQTGGKDMGRPPVDEPDAYVYVPSVKVGELCVDVERLDAHLALRTQVANLVNRSLPAGDQAAAQAPGQGVSEAPRRPVADVEIGGRWSARSVRWSRSAQVRTRLIGEVDNEALTERQGLPERPAVQRHYKEVARRWRLAAWLRSALR
jgi:hypothetical protein